MVSESAANSERGCGHGLLAAACELQQQKPSGPLREGEAHAEIGSGQQPSSCARILPGAMLKDKSSERAASKAAESVKGEANACSAKPEGISAKADASASAAKQPAGNLVCSMKNHCLPQRVNVTEVRARKV